MKTEKPDNHFFASSIAQWATTTDERDLRDLIKLMDQDGYAYNLFLVQGPFDAEYEINFYQPKGVVAEWVGFFEPKKSKRTKTKATTGTFA
jgi:hypothetical protein